MKNHQDVEKFIIIAVDHSGIVWRDRVRNLDFLGARVTDKIPFVGRTFVTPDKVMRHGI